jgi:hypothetical protein
VKWYNKYKEIVVPNKKASFKMFAYMFKTISEMKTKKPIVMILKMMGRRIEKVNKPFPN